MTIELIISAVEEALLHEERDLTVDAFRRAYRRKASCADALDPIVAENWQSIDTRKLFGSSDPSPRSTVANLRARS
ncbi:hypothetical protein [Paracoccus sp. (in: a-proteobacteria)]|uniref:hypothetical protein n=1 Tax=Paracoccus sp. TaxID=267 RepID=UPI00396C485F